MKSHQSSLYLFAFALLAASFIKTEVCTSLNAQPSLVHLSLASEKKHSATVPVIVTWCSDKSFGEQYVRYGLSPEVREVRKAARTELSDKVVLNVVLKNLKPGAKYYYRCGSDIEGWSPMYSFNSEPDTGTFRVAVIGDTQNASNNAGFSKTRMIADIVRTYSPSFTLHMGDLVENGSVSSNWSGLLSVTEELNATSPLMPVLGNHDVENKTGDDFQKPFTEFISLFNLPGDEVNYSFTYGNARFIGIFSGCAQAAEKTDQVKYKPGSPEYAWLDNELSKAEKDKRIGWTVVWMHYPVKSFGWSNVSRWRENVLPLLEKHRVDICLAGHRHVYERHFQVKDGIPVKHERGSQFTAKDGTIFITNGTAGGNPTGSGGRNLNSMAFTPDESMYSFAIMDVATNSITFSVFDQENNLIDRFSINK
jgi:predicted phosphodiesterase